jgi:hypothetical protein
MDSTGKWYLWRNMAESPRHFWTGVSWMPDPTKAMFFSSFKEADSEARDRADCTTKAEVVVGRATRNVFQ